MRDVWLVARFEVFRAIRTWRALALLVLYGVASAGACWLFVRFVGLLENSLAQQLRVPVTKTPGAMLGRLVTSDMWHDVVAAMCGSETLADHLVSIPPLAMFHLWLGFLLVPFFAASASAECIAIDVQSRAVRYELLRTGRIEIVVGRFLGQLALTGAASALSMVTALGVGLGFMLVDDPLALAGWMLVYTPRAWAFGIPFVALGVTASQLTASPAWARVMAIGAAASSWVLLGVARWMETKDGLGLAADVMLQLLPQGWIRGMWDPGWGWLASSAACAALAGAGLVVGYVRFSRRDL
ncbi:MAG: hypothetical protein H6738_19090 [Alphaproteobacteria bacterium]|nr:hypothetical protein [Alphaproteobacteria bacterium]MCB9698895.1 hypothetical protein [Alphaproteobacteria bacterium]